MERDEIPVRGIGVGFGAVKRLGHLVLLFCVAFGPEFAKTEAGSLESSGEQRCACEGSLAFGPRIDQRQRDLPGLAEGAKIHELPGLFAGTAAIVAAVREEIDAQVFVLQLFDDICSNAGGLDQGSGSAAFEVLDPFGGQFGR